MRTTKSKETLNVGLREWSDLCRCWMMFSVAEKASNCTNGWNWWHSLLGNLKFTRKCFNKDILWNWHGKSWMDFICLQNWPINKIIDFYLCMFTGGLKQCKTEMVISLIELERWEEPLHSLWKINKIAKNGWEEPRRQCERAEFQYLMWFNLTTTNILFAFMFRYIVVNNLIEVCSNKDCFWAGQETRFARNEPIVLLANELQPIL